jgi:hypothetical protein
MPRSPAEWNIRIERIVVVARDAGAFGNEGLGGMLDGGKGTRNGLAQLDTGLGGQRPGQKREEEEITHPLCYSIHRSVCIATLFAAFPAEFGL